MRILMDKIGEAVKTVRKRYHLKAKQVYSGLLSQSAYQKLENGVREIRPHILEAVLSRLGIVCNYIGVLISNKNFKIYYLEEEYKKCLIEEKYSAAEQIKDKFIEEYGLQDNVLKQRGYKMEAELACRKENNLKKALELYNQAFYCTVSFDMLKEDMQLFSKEELKLSIQIVELFMKIGEMKKAEQCLWKIKSYITIFPKKSDKANEEAKVYYYLATFLFERKEYQEVLSYLEKSIVLLSKMEGFTIQGDLFFYRARTLEILYRQKEEWKNIRNSALRDFITAYYVYEFQEKKEKCGWIQKYVEENYKWKNI